MGSNIRRGNYLAVNILKRTTPFSNDEENNQEFNGVTVKMKSLRYDTFRESTSCHVCGIRGTYMGLDSGQGCNQKNRGHFNLYATDTEGKEVLMTKGSKLDPRGYKTTCAVCAKELDKTLWRPKGGVTNVEA
ncbi:MAG: hypothetical protein PHY48_14440 [Candidatus Cloacimonetes bacterium]|nr:hypothetical protein [Candidatus Cloacimonadota bacterium]